MDDTGNGGVRKGVPAADYNGVSDAEPETADGNSSVSESGTRVRETFLDNPVFVTGRLGADGEAAFVFTVPDNITSWRITATAADLPQGSFAEARFGNAVSDAVCTMDFFISLSAPSYFIEGDDASMLARSFGILSGGQISYSATLKDDSGNVISTAGASDDSKGYAQLNFGKLGTGHYSVTVYGNSSSASDALVTEFDVVRSAQIMRTYSAVGLGEIGKISPALFPVTITFMEESTQQRLLENVISVLKYGNGSERSDMLAAKYAALSVSSRMYGTDESEEIDSVRRQMREYLHPLVSLLKYSEEDVELTANILAFAPDLFDSSSKSQLVMELRGMIEAEYQSDAVTLCATLSALASLDEPVLDILYSVADYAGDYPAEAKLHLACAFASLGDWTAASAVYGQVRDEMAVTDKEYGTMRFGETEGSDTSRLTALALAAASRCCRSDALMLARYLCENVSLTDVSTCGLAAFARYYLPDAVFTEKKLTVRIKGEEKELTVSPFSFESVTLSKSEFDSFEIVSAADGIIAGVNYYASAADVLGERTLSGRVKIDKRIEPYGNGLYKVTLTVYGTSTRVSESFDISDVVPSGARFFSLYNDSDSYSREGNVHASAWLWNPAGQRVNGGVHIYNSYYANLRENGDYLWKTDCPEYSFSVSVGYVIRAAVTGEFIAESAAVRNLATDIYSVSGRNLITISENGWTVKPVSDLMSDIAKK